MDTKICNKCGETKLLSEFHKDSHKKGGLCTLCKCCKRDNTNTWRALNPEKDKANSAEWYHKNKHDPELKERMAFNNRKWRKDNPHLNAAKEARRRASKLKATPTWLMPEHHAHIKRTYKLAKTLEDITGDKYHVDHIIPLQGNEVCGLHVPWNLQVVSASLNLSKSNKYQGD